jgi:hypothetical protein
MCVEKEDNVLIHVRSFILKPNALKESTNLHMGFTNHCYKGDKIFHLFLDCDRVKLGKIFDGILLLREEFPELHRVKFLILSTSPFHFSLVSFVRLSWKRYLEILWYAVEIGIEHEGHAVYSMGKGYAVLRVGAKYGIVPTILCSIGTNVSCKKCLREFTNIFDEIPFY